MMQESQYDAILNQLIKKEDINLILNSISIRNETAEIGYSSTDVKKIC